MTNPPSPNEALREALEKMTEAEKTCPANIYSLGGADCPRCGASRSQNCGPQTGAAFAVVAAARSLSQPPASSMVGDGAWHGERPENIREAIAQFWSQWEDERAGRGAYLPEELAEDAGNFANDLFDHLASLSPLSSEPEAYYADDEPLSAEDQARIDAAWEKHKAADPVCRIPPEGWSCSRAAGHEGPCAASPSGEPASVAGERVTQADREAAVDIYNVILHDWHTQHMLDGMEDECYVIQAFARHRLAALSETPPPPSQEGGDGHD